MIDLKYRIQSLKRQGGEGFQVGVLVGTIYYIVYIVTKCLVIKKKKFMNHGYHSVCDVHNTVHFCCSM